MASISVWQQLGAFVASGRNLTDDHLAKFSEAGGKWIIVLLAQLGYADDHDEDCVWNLANIDSLKLRAAKYGIRVGGWFNAWAGGKYENAPEGGIGTTAVQDAEKVAEIVHAHNIGPTVLDCEIAYKLHPQELPKLLFETRKRLPTRSIGVSTNEPNDALIWNGGALGPKASMLALEMRLLPQWYNAPAYGQGRWMQPDQTMQFMIEHGNEGNFFLQKGLYHRAIPLSYIHGTLEVTGLEGANLAGELEALARAKRFGYTKGFQIYILERTPDSDFALIKARRGQLFA